ncbi:hypothetical protein NPIL_539031 [Nephila pilipes]|uniref:Transmembrane protein n=1 Tax=Nephila pilipes TaxID=299642 RepID=A0A8X6NX07_NEPPI|nr:hypothetical protein NPIL_539031 [Nephila pilipes]
MTAEENKRQVLAYGSGSIIFFIKMRLTWILVLSAVVLLCVIQNNRADAKSVPQRMKRAPQNDDASFTTIQTTTDNDSSSDSSDGDDDDDDDEIIIIIDWPLIRNWPFSWRWPYFY